MKLKLLNLLVSLLVIGVFVAAIHKSETHSRIQVPYPLIDSVDAETGLALDPNFMLIKAHCTGCHSPKLILQHRFTRDEWLSKIRWMQRNHKLWDLGDSEKIVLDYLVKNYAPNQSTYSRREVLRNVKWYKLDK
jgi:hypothetical protein